MGVSPYASSGVESPPQKHPVCADKRKKLIGRRIDERTKLIGYHICKKDGRHKERVVHLF